MNHTTPSRILFVATMLTTGLGARCQQQSGRSDDQAVSAKTAAMQRFLDALEPDDGWLARPPGLPAELWTDFRSRYRLAPAGNEPDLARVGLGRLLFFDARLSADRSLSCASCHDPRRGFADGRRTPVGVGGAKLTRNAPTVMNAALQHNFFWDGRVRSLESQAAGPLLNAAEMGMADEASVVARVREVPQYVALFELAYGRPPEFVDVTRALAAFQRTLIFNDAPFDAFWAGDEDEISAAARAGFELFTEHCRSCHLVSLRAPNFTDGNFHNLGVGADRFDYKALARSGLSKRDAPDAGDRAAADRRLAEHGELGRALHTRIEYNVGAFRTAPLRNVALTAPYMHDGSFETLWDVVEHYNEGGTPNTWLDPRIEPLGLTPMQVDQIVAFLFTLTDRRFADQNAAEFDTQDALRRDH